MRVYKPGHKLCGETFDRQTKQKPKTSFPPLFLRFPPLSHTHWPKLLITTNPLWLLPAASLGSWEIRGARGKIHWGNAERYSERDLRQGHKQNSKMATGGLVYLPVFPRFSRGFSAAAAAAAAGDQRGVNDFSGHFSSAFDEMRAERLLLARLISRTSQGAPFNMINSCMRSAHNNTGLCFI